MTGKKIWWQSSTALDSHPILKSYCESLGRHAAEVLSANLEIEIKGVTRGTFELEHPYFEYMNNWEIMENLYKAQEAGYGAIAVGCFLDPGVRQIRTVADIPVLGLAETSMLTACLLGRRFSIVTYTPGLADKKYPALIREYGLSERAGPVGCMNISLDQLAKGFDKPEPIIIEFLRVSEESVAAGAEVILPGCGLLNMILADNGVRSLADGKVPIVDVVGVLLAQTEAMMRLKKTCGLGVSRQGYYVKPDNVAEVRRIYGLE